ncbi:SDR family NAD(P)-dependent oxidoreductase [Aestuariibacter salexigens]|uniref:SDR family NAD(P)-dependent oxidoreductase n=1 Tax=Aestuariibacter salexigens TaxID=226010 RepID=UPI0003F83302|nr:SDR family NAD(P)-dependent oxidoreductase [Aestuariibacter salexigens]
MLEHKSILITGANGGIGQSVATVCHLLGATVLLAGRDDSALQTLAERLGDNAIPMCYDLCDEKQVREAFSHIQQHLGLLDGLVCAAGAMLDAPLAMTRGDDLQSQWQINAASVFLHAQLASRLMSRNKRGCIITLGSVVAEQGSSGQSAYAMTKSALGGLTRSLAKELAPVNIRVNCVAPGFIETPMTASYSGEKRRAVLDKIGLKRPGLPKEVADLISFLLSDHAAYITGQTIGIDGGISL